MEIRTVGGYNEVGRNMTAVKVGEEVVIFDMGLHIEKVITYEGEDQQNLSTDKLKKIGALPDLSSINDWRDKVKAICIGHCHLDHLGAVPHLAREFPNAPIIGTAYTIEILKDLLKDVDDPLPNRLVVLSANSDIKVSKDLKIEFVHITHSTLQAVTMVLHSKEGKVVYCNDFKLDNHPVLGKKPNMKRFRQIGKDGVKVLIIDSLNSEKYMKTPSEKVAASMLKDVVMGTANRGNSVIVTTFSSHIARLKSILELGQRMGRKVVFLGRSLHRYISAAEKLNLINFSSKAEVVGYSKHVKKTLKKINKQGRDKYLIVCTGNQGEPNAMLSRMVKKEVPWTFHPGDNVVFSCRVIPSPMNQSNRELLERRLKNQKVRIFKDIHVSGHASREDHRDFIEALKPEHIIPSHGELSKLSAMADLASEMDYNLGKTVHILQNGQKLKLGK